MSDDRLVIDGQFMLAKEHIEGRRYKVVVLDTQAPPGHRLVWRSPGLGWNRRERDRARAWIEAGRP